MTLVISRKAARALGLKRFFLGIPCSHGHVAERYTVNSLCVECGKERRAKWYYSDPSLKSKIDRANARHREKMKNPTYAAGYRQATNERARQRRRDPVMGEVLRAKTREYRRNQRILAGAARQLLEGAG